MSQAAEAAHEVREMLRIARHYNQELGDLRLRLREAENGLRLSEQGAQAAPSPWRRRAASPPPTRERMAQVYAEEVRRAGERIEHIRTRRALLDRLLKRLSEVELRIISLRWLDGKSWRAISLRVFICERHCQRIQKQAIETMARALIEEQNGDS